MLQSFISTLLMVAIIILSGVVVWHVAAPLIFVWFFVGIPAIVRYVAPIIEV